MKKYIFKVEANSNYSYWGEDERIECESGKVILNVKAQSEKEAIIKSKKILKRRRFFIIEINECL